MYIHRIRKLWSQSSETVSGQEKFGHSLVETGKIWTVWMRQEKCGHSLVETLVSEQEKCGHSLVETRKMWTQSS